MSSDKSLERESPSRNLAVQCDATGWMVEVVFDAYETRSAEQQTSVDGVVVTFTGRGARPTHIERHFEELRSDVTNMIVITGLSSYLCRLSSRRCGLPTYVKRS